MTPVRTSEGFPRWWQRIARRRLIGVLGASAVAPAALAQLPQVRDGGNAERRRQAWVSDFPGQQVWGYADRHSVVSGETFDIMLSTGPEVGKAEGRLEFFRIGHYSSGQRLIWSSPSIRLEYQPASRTAAAIGANWDPTLWSVDPSNWPPGCYSADFVHEPSGVREPRVVQIVVRNPKANGGVLLKLATNTYQAYNRWGGHSLYPDAPDSNDIESRGASVSFDRPTRSSFFEYDVFLVTWMESLGVGVDYATNFDVHRDADLLEKYPVVACSAHDEYWSKEEFDAFERRIFHGGGNTIFYGGNTAYWQVRYADVNRVAGGEDRGRQVICFKSTVDPIARRASPDPSLLVTARFRDGARRPETMLTGVAYESWFPFKEDDTPVYPYFVASTDAPFFEGTGYRPGDAAADVVGYEWDNRDPDHDGKRLWDAGRSRIPELPVDRIHVLFQGSPIDASGKPGRAEAIFFKSAAGAKVFSSGSIRWAWGLGKPGFERAPFKRFNENLIRDFLA